MTQVFDPNEKLTIRETPLFPLVRVIVIQICIAIIYWLLSLPGSRNSFTYDFPLINWLRNLGYTILPFINLGFIAIILVQWFAKSYIVEGGELIMRLGLFSKNLYRHEVKNLEFRAVEQTMLGRVFHYGNLKLEDKEQGEEIVLTNIPNPDIYFQKAKPPLSQSVNEVVEPLEEPPAV